MKTRAKKIAVYVCSVLYIYFGWLWPLNLARPWAEDVYQEGETADGW